MQITVEEHMKIGLGHDALVPVEGLGMEQGFLSGETKTSLMLPETPSKIPSFSCRVTPVA
jgi:hypothetical protein